MEPNKWKGIKELFNDLLELSDVERERELQAIERADSIQGRLLRELLFPAAVGTTGPFGRTPAKFDRVLTDGTVLCGRYRVGALLGHGGMGEVYEAEDEELPGDRIAVKTLRKEIANDPKFLARFKQEIRLARRVAHPNVCKIFEFRRHSDSDREISFLTMEFVDGEPLAAYLRRGFRLQPEDSLPFLLGMAEGLAALHANQIVHRDFKPGNVMVIGDVAEPTSLRPVIMDFGLAQPGAAEGQVKTDGETGELVGTIGYLPPELVERLEVGPSADVYAFGVTAGQAIGLLELGADHKIRWHTPPDGISRGLRLCIERCCEASQEDRYQDFGPVVQALRAESRSRLAALADGISNGDLHTRRWLLVAGAAAAGIGAWALTGGKENDPRDRAILVYAEGGAQKAYLDALIPALAALVPGLAIVAGAELEYYSSLMASTPDQIFAEEGKLSELIYRAGAAAAIGISAASVESADIRFARAGNPSTSRARIAPPLPRTALGEATSADPQAAAEAVKTWLDGIPADFEPPQLSAVTTDSLDALLAYEKAVEARAKNDLPAAIRWLEAAISYDPEFASAESRLAIALTGVGRYAEAMDRISSARAHASEVSAVERHAVEASYQFFLCAADRSTNAYQDLSRVLSVQRDTFRAHKARLSAASAEAQYQLAFSLGRRGLTAQALRAAQAAAELDPSRENLAGGAVIAAVQNSSWDRAADLLERARDHHGDNTYFYWGEGLLRLGLADFDGALESFDNLARDGEIFASWASLLRAKTYIVQCRWQPALAAIESGRGTDHTQRYQSNDHRRTYRVARLQQLVGQNDAAGKTIGGFLELAPQPAIAESFRNGGLLALELGDDVLFARFREALQAVANDFPCEYAIDLITHLDGEAARLAGDFETAENLLADSRIRLGDPYALQSLARLRYDRGDYEGCAALCTALLELQGWIFRNARWMSSVWTQAHLQASEAYGQLGQESRSVQHRDIYKRWTAATAS